MKYVKTDQNLTRVKFTNIDMASDRMLLESRKKEMLKSLKKNTIDFKRINNLHKRIQNVIEEEKKRGEDNIKLYKEELKKLQNTLSADSQVFEIFKKKLLDHELLIDDVKSLLTDGLRKYLSYDQNKSEGPESLDIAEEDQLIIPLSEIPQEEKEGENEKEAETVAAIEKKVVKKPAVEKLTPIEKDILVEWRKRKILHQVAQGENILLNKYYQYLNDRSKDMDIKYMEMSHYHNLKEAVLRRYMTKAADLNQLVLRKIKRCVIPPRNPADELKSSINGRMKESEALRNLLTVHFACIDKDLEFEASFRSSLKELYSSLILQEAPESEEQISLENKSDEPNKNVIPVETEKK
ncbi:hypothetical protein NPIL_121151 [Nephila pilipes]|uniref:Uncharacterized protein n=1 Tax=Nephila pilipes TaxID=299642 RepID=A0A8X6K4C0_NEPPI|nr:hypothetical protein NPIL_121151 [Nephila pilipes]